jgi:hypothetical protein
MIGENSDRQLGMLISKSGSALSWVLTNLKSVAAFDEQISEICQALESVSGQLNDLAENRFPIKLDPKIADDIKASREICEGQGGPG